MSHRTITQLVTIVLAVACSTLDAHAQIKAETEDSLQRFGNIQVSRYRVGVTLAANKGAVRDILAIVPVPLACPEQEVVLIEEDFTGSVGVHEFRELQGNNARQLVVKIPYLANKAEARALLTFEVRTRAILPPKNTDDLVIPSKKAASKLKRYLGKSPFIETKNSKFKKIVRQIFAELETASQKESAEQTNESAPQESSPEELVGGETDDDSDDDETKAKAKVITDWQRVEAIYDHVQNTIKYKAQDDKSALATLKDGHGDCQNISVLFVALCRTAKIPARLVWVHQHVYSEFCLADAEGKLHWFPCETSGGSTIHGTAGARSFGEMPVQRVIMQKGDNFKTPERRKALRYAAEYMIALPAQQGGGKPSHKFIREQL